MTNTVPLGTFITEEDISINCFVFFFLFNIGGLEWNIIVTFSQKLAVNRPGPAFGGRGDA